MINDKGNKVGYVQLFEFGGLAGARRAPGRRRRCSKQGAQSFILDLRYNPGGLLTQAVDVTDVFQTGPRDLHRRPALAQRGAHGDGPGGHRRSRWSCSSTATRPAPRRSSPARSRTTSGPTIIGTHDLRQGPGADHRRPRQRRRAQAHHRRVPHARTAPTSTRRASRRTSSRPTSPRRRRTTRCSARCSTSPRERSRRREPLAASGRSGRQGEHAGGRGPGAADAAAEQTPAAAGDSGPRPPAPVPRHPLGQVLVARAAVRRRPLLPGRQGRHAAAARRPRARRARRTATGAGSSRSSAAPTTSRRCCAPCCTPRACARASPAPCWRRRPRSGARAARPDHGRRDLTALPTFTIDPDTARDFDDAISVAREGAGYRAHVHIADVSYFVDDDGAIEREARRRTSSLYLPLFAEPMLPAALSSDLCSLVPRQPRKCVTVEFTFDAAGPAHRRAVLPLADQQRPPPDLRLRRHGHRAGGRAGRRGGRRRRRGGRRPAGRPKAAVAALPGAHLVAGRPEPPRDVPDATMEADAELREQLRLAAELAGVLRRRRLARGALTLGSFEPEYAFDHAGALVGAVARPETPSHALVEEFMLAANEAVAEFLLRKKARTLYRVHEPPDAGERARAARRAGGAGRAHAAVPGRPGRAGGAARRGLRPPQPPRRPDERPRGPRPPRLVDAAAALAQAGALRAGQPRPLRPRQPGVPALHLADPPLPRPRDPPQPAVPPG